jgi:hypothetical protein
MNPKGEVNSQLNIWSFDRARSVIVMREFDTLGFGGTYVQDKAASAPDRCLLVSESLELTPDGKGFKPYVTNRLLKSPSPT